MILAVKRTVSDIVSASRLILRAALSAAAAILITGNCSINRIADGSNTSETTNGVSALLTDSSGIPATGATVYLRPASYLADISEGATAQTVTDSLGAFSFDSLDTGDYMIEAQGQHATAALIRCSFKSRDSSAVLGTLRLQAKALIDGAVSVNDTIDPKTITVRVFGLDIKAAANAQGLFSLAVPAGPYRLHASAGNPNYVPIALQVDSVAPGVRATVDTITLSHINKQLRGYWALDDGSGAIIADGSGSGYDGSLTGGQWIDGVKGKALDFEQSSGNIDVGDPADGGLDFGTGPFAITAWFKVGQAPPVKGESYRIISKAGEDSAGLGLSVGADSALWFHLPIDSGMTWAKSIKSWIPVIDNKWHHLSAMRNTASQITLFVDGKRVGIRDSAFVSIANDNSFVIGGQNSLAVNNFRGSLDEIRVYSRSLSIEEVRFLAEGN